MEFADRAARNEEIFRGVNERIQEGAEQHEVKAPIENNADVNLRDRKEKMSPLQWARRRGDPEIIAMLEKAGAKE